MTLKKTFACVWLVLALPLSASAGFLAMEGVNELSFRLTDGGVRVSGNYQVLNRGNERANDVFVALSLAGWVHVTPPQPLEPDGRAVWSIDQTIPVELLKCHDQKKGCPPADLPLRGVFPLLVITHYRDTNSYPFSAVHVDSVALGDLSPEDTYMIQAPEIQGVFTLTNDGRNTFSGKLEVTNHSSEEQHIFTSLHTSRELRVESPTAVFDVAPSGRTSVPVTVHNYTGTINSAYRLLALMQWEENDLRHLAAAWAVLNVVQEERDRSFALMLAIAAAILAAGITIYFRRRVG